MEREGQIEKSMPGGGELKRGCFEIVYSIYKSCILVWNATLASDILCIHVTRHPDDQCVHLLASTGGKVISVSLSDLTASQLCVPGHHARCWQPGWR